MGTGFVSIHAPRAGCDQPGSTLSAREPQFQSTHPVRGATSVRVVATSTRLLFQSTHPVRGATVSQWRAKHLLIVSIHAPRAGCDGLISILILSGNGFQSTHPVRGATISASSIWRCASVSIHAPRAGCDHRCSYIGGGGKCFNPRTPCGVRRVRPLARMTTCLFQSTHPVRGATGRAN